MTWKIWKQPLERASEEFQNGYRKGLNLSDWNSAFSNFNSAYELYNQAGDRANAELAKALALFSKALAVPQSVENWANAAIALNNTGLMQIDAPRTVPTKDLIEECNLKASELSDRTVTNNLERANRLEQTAKKYLSIANRSLLVPLLLEKQQTTGTARAHRIIAEASQIRGNEEIDSDPKHAAEYYRMAAMHMKAVGDTDATQFYYNKAQDFSASALCYFCGREVIGKDINFVYMKANLTQFIEKQNSAKILPSSVGNMVVACRGCHSAITIAADEIARFYFDKAEVEIQQLRAEIMELRGRINSVSTRVR